MIPILLSLLLPASAQEYRFPTTDAHYGYFYPTAYYDHGGNTDWDCSNWTYSGHRGSDYGVGGFEGMDEGRDVVAAADGTVVTTNDGEYDECTTGDCGGGGGYGNYVKIEHDDGRFSYYAHMKNGSVAVAVGDRVSCGQALGQVGSSGNSTGPHLHFEVREASGTQVDPFDGACSSPPSYWVAQGTHGSLPSPTCAESAPCEPEGALACGESVAGRSDGGGATSAHTFYGCEDWTYSGPERSWRFATDRDEGVSVTLSGLSADLDLYVLASAACDGGDCLGSSSNAEGDEVVSFQAAAGVEYVLLIDGWEGAVSDFTLSVDCAGAWPGEGGDSDPPPDSDAPDSAADTGGLPGGDSADPGGPGGGPGGQSPPDAQPITWTRQPLPQGGCGCGGGPPGSAPGLLALLGARRRRRQPR